MVHLIAAFMLANEAKNNPLGCIVVLGGAVVVFCVALMFY